MAPPKEIINMAIININKGNVEGRRHQAASMVQWWITPLLNTCLKKSQIRKTNNKFSIAYFLAALAVFSTLNGSFVAADPQEEISVQDGILDVLFIDSQCIVENEECKATRAGNIIEYFGADWDFLKIESELVDKNKKRFDLIALSVLILLIMGAWVSSTAGGQYNQSCSV